MGLFGLSKKEIKAENERLRIETERLQSLLTPEQIEAKSLMDRIADLKQSCAEVEKDILAKKQAVLTLSKEASALDLEISSKKSQIVGLVDDISFQEFGMYKPSYVFANSDLYKDKLTKIRDEQKQCIKDDLACTGSTSWTVNGNEAKGRAMVKDMKKLLLRAFNVE